MPRDFDCRGRRAVLCTMHGKEAVIAPVLKEGLGLEVVVAPGIDTDAFGTFTREVPRPGSQMDAARAKIAAAFAAMPDAEIAIASEGSFAAHPHIPIMPVGRELVLLVDRARGFEISGADETFNTTHSHAIVQSAGDALEAAQKMRFPSHGVIIMASRDGRPAPNLFICKTIDDEGDLLAAASRAIDLCGAAQIESDMRAHRNPTRMAAIARASLDLVHRFGKPCPRCNHPGFDSVERIPGLPCRSCGLPTGLPRAHVMRCAGCDHSLVRLASSPQVADPAQCPTCNP